MANRPFAVGDMVISKRYGKGVIKTYIPETFSISPLFVHFESIERFWCYEKDIKTIRTPRKGSKEARDIVAMLANRYHKNIIKDWKKSNLKKKLPLKSVYKSWTVSGQDAYKKAKSMLK